jgi:peptide/nickel transport system permease protein
MTFGSPNDPEPAAMMQFLSLAGRRAVAALPALLIILAGLFLLLQLAPGDTVDALVAQVGGADPSMIEELRRYYGLDQSTGTRLTDYLWRLAHLDLGSSAIYGKPVSEVIIERMPATLLLMGSSLFIAFAAGMALGMLAALRVNKWQDSLISTLGLLFYATPSFWFGLMGIVVFAVYLDWLPVGGFGIIGMDRHTLAGMLDIARHLILPTITLALIFLAVYLRIMRASLLEVSTLDFVRTARSKGLPERTVLRRHILRNALLPMVTLAGLQAGTMLGGAVVVESVFALPGMGRLAYESVMQRDLNTLLGVVFASALLVIAINFTVDLIYARLDPRINQGK